MIKENQRTLNVILVLIDFVVVICSLFFAHFIRFKPIFFGPIGGSLPSTYYFIFTLVVVPVHILFYYFFGLYKPFRNLESIFSNVTSIIKSDVMAFVFLVAFLFIIDEPDFSRIMLLLLCIFGIIFTVIERAIIMYVLRRLRTSNRNLKHMLIVGDNDLAFNFASKIEEKSYLGYSIGGFIGRVEHVGQYHGKYKYLGSFNDFKNVLKKNRFDRVIIAIPMEHYYHLNEVVNICEEEGIRAEIIPDYYRYLPAKPSVEMIEDMPIINIRHVPLDSPFNKFLKITSDIVISIIAIVVTSPIMLVTAIAIKLTSPGPIIFKQERIGYRGKPFMMYKFRSMYVQNLEEEKSEWTTKNDSRKTPVGNFVRKTSIDELPQFFNVLKGQMSVVGPRPERPFFVEEFRKDIPKYMVKHQIRPGLTGLAQVNGYRGNTSIQKRIEYDIRYVENWHLNLDIRIMILTCIKRNPNAY